VTSRFYASNDAPKWDSNSVEVISERGSDDAPGMPESLA